MHGLYLNIDIMLFRQYTIVDITDILKTLTYKILYHNEHRAFLMDNYILFHSKENKLNIRAE